MKKVLITGASGRIGRHVVPLLLEHGYAVRVLMHRTPMDASWASQDRFPTNVEAAYKAVVGK